VSSDTGVVTLDLPVSVEGGEVVVPIRLKLAEGTTEAQVQLRLTLRLHLEK
jgi:hypothetical protein